MAIFRQKKNTNIFSVHLEHFYTNLGVPLPGPEALYDIFLDRGLKFLPGPGPKIQISSWGGLLDIYECHRGAIVNFRPPV